MEAPVIRPSESVQPMHGSSAAAPMMVGLMKVMGMFYVFCSTNKCSAIRLVNEYELVNGSMISVDCLRRSRLFSCKISSYLRFQFNFMLLYICSSIKPVFSPLTNAFETCKNASNFGHYSAILRSYKGPPTLTRIVRSSCSSLKTFVLKTLAAQLMIMFRFWQRSERCSSEIPRFFLICKKFDDVV